MPRRKKKRVIEITDWGPLRAHRLYHGRIRSVSIKGAPDHLQVEMVNLDPKELDRVHTVDLPLPPRPGNRTAAFLRACGFDVTVGASIDPDELVDHVVGFRLCDQATDGPEQFDFEAVTPTTTAKTAASTPEPSETRSPAEEDPHPFHNYGPGADNPDATLL